MQVEAKPIDNIPDDKKARFESAKKNYDRITIELLPYVRKREVKTFSTSGKWIVSEEQR
jgi:hypothetical protein